MSDFNSDEILVSEQYSAGDIADMVLENWKLSHPGESLSEEKLRAIVPMIADELEKNIICAADQFVNDLNAYIDESIESIEHQERLKSSI